jgi:hypothetical protein
MLEAMARIAPPQLNDAMERIAPQRKYADPQLGSFGED